MSELQSLYDLESDLVDGYTEDPLIDNWIDEVLDVLGFGTNVETTPGGAATSTSYCSRTPRRDGTPPRST